MMEVNVLMTGAVLNMDVIRQRTIAMIITLVLLTLAIVLKGANMHLFLMMIMTLVQMMIAKKLVVLFTLL